jgi:predicted secreted protein
VQAVLDVEPVPDVEPVSDPEPEPRGGPGEQLAVLLACEAGKWRVEGIYE